MPSSPASAPRAAVVPLHAPAATPGVSASASAEADSDDEALPLAKNWRNKRYRAKRRAEFLRAVKHRESRLHASRKWFAKNKEHHRQYMKAYHDKKRAEQPCVPSPQLAVAMGHPCVPSAQDKGALGPPRALTGMATPQDGDRILVFRPRWLNLLLDEEKDLEIRGRNLSSGPCWLGCRGTIYGHCFLVSPILIDSIEAWRGLRHRHRVEVDELPYKTTYGFPVHQCRRVTLTSYEHPRGAVGIVRFHRASSRHKGQRPPSGGA